MTVSDQARHLRVEVSSVSIKYQVPADAQTGSPALRSASGIPQTHSRQSSATESTRTSSRQPSKDSYPLSPKNSTHQQVHGILVHESPESSSSADEIAKSMTSRHGNPAATRAKVEKGKRGEGEDDDADDDDSPTFLPFAGSPAKARAPTSEQADPSATLRGGFGTPRGPQRPGVPRRQTSERIILETRPTEQPSTLTSSTSSASSGPAPPAPRHRHNRSNPNLTNVQGRTPGLLSPRQAAALGAAGLSPRGRPGTGKDGSDGTPSMGSSFSDLDDASVTQSALEEALLSNMGNNGNASVASRVSGISQAFRSRYFDAQSRPAR